MNLTTMSERSLLHFAMIGVAKRIRKCEDTLKNYPSDGASRFMLKRYNAQFAEICTRLEELDELNGVD